MAQLSQYSRDFWDTSLILFLKLLIKLQINLKLGEKYLSNSVLIAADLYEQFVSVALLKEKIKETVV